MALPIQMKYQLQTDRLTLRPHTAADIPALVRLLTDRANTETCLVPDFTSEAQAISLAQKLVEFSQVSDTQHLQYGIDFQGQLIGFITDCGIEADTIEIGYILDPAYQGHGYTTEATHSVINDLRRMGFKKVTAEFFDTNTASRRVLEKCGLRPTGSTETLEYRGVAHTCIGYSLDL